MIAKTEGLVLRVFPFSETSHVVVWLTADGGRIATAVKGACRPKSPFAGQYDLFYTCELVFYRRERDGLHIAKECVPLCSRSRFRNDWRAFSCASYVCGLVSGITFAGGHEVALYEHVSAALDSFSDHGAVVPVLLWFEIRLARILGFAPQLQRCSVCHGGLDRAMRTAFSPRQGGLVCPDCAPRQPGDAVRLSPDVVAILRRWQEAKSPVAARHTRCTPNQMLALQDSVGTFLQYHLDYVPPGRRIAIEMMSSQPKLKRDPEMRENR